MGFRDEVCFGDINLNVSSIEIKCKVIGLDENVLGGSMVREKDLRLSFVVI